MPHSIEAAVAIEALDYQEDCIMNFFDDHYSEIEDIRCQIEEDLGQPIQVKGDLKNFFSWLAFEETARKMIEAMGIEL